LFYFVKVMKKKMKNLHLYLHRVRDQEMMNRIRPTISLVKVEIRDDYLGMLKRCLKEVKRQGKAKGKEVFQKLDYAI